ncbi:MAG: insulinase family protein, partial [Acidobacteriota bacterium]|nr:insulinase family protein [Acidobacteriota bacterium]
MLKNTISFVSSIVVFSVLLALFGVPAVSAGTPEDAVTAGPVEQVLPSGARALLWPRPGSGTVLVTVAVPAGSEDEPRGMGGLSHYLEHLLFDGYDDLDERDVTEAFEVLSAYMNAFTREQATVYFALVPREDAVRAAELMVGMLTRSTINEAVYEKEKKVILEELAKDHASPDGLKEERLRSVLWNGTPLEHPVGGSVTSVEATTRDEVVEYYKVHYVPSGYRILITGDLGPSGLAEVLAPFAGLEAGAPPPPREDSLSWPGWGEWESAQAPEAPAGSGGPPAGMGMSHGMGGPPGGPSGGTLEIVIAAPDAAAQSGTSMEVLARWLSDPSGPLAAVLVPALAADVGVSRLPREPRDMLQIRVEAGIGVDPEDLLATTLGALAAAASGPDDASVASIQRTWAGERALNDQRLHYAAVFYGAALAAGRGELVEAVAPPVVTPASVRTTAADLLGGAAARTRAGWIGKSGPEGRTPLPQAAAVKVPARMTAFEPGPLGSVVATLGNGLVVGILPEEGSDVFGIHLLVADRTLREPADAPGIADLVHRLLPGGTVLGPGQSLAQRIERAGFEVKIADSPMIPFDNRYHVPDFSYVRIEGPAAGLETALMMLAEMVRVPSWDEAGWRSAAGDHGAARKADNRGSEKAKQLFLGALLGDDYPLAQPVSGPLDGAPSRPESVRAFWGIWPAGYFAPDRLVVSVASPLAVADTLEIVESALGDGPPAQPQRGPYPEWRPAASAPQVETGDAPQVIVLWGRIVEVDEADRAALLVAMDALSDRMTAVIREREGLAYRLGAGIRHVPGGAWVLSATVGTRPENSQQVGELIVALVAGLGAEPLSGEDIERLNSRARRTRMLRGLSAASRAYRVGRAVFEGPASPLAID